MLLVYENKTDGIAVEWKKTVHFPPHLHEAIEVVYINAQKRDLLHLNGFCQYYKNLHSGFNRSHHKLYSVRNS